MEDETRIGAAQANSLRGDEREAALPDAGGASGREALAHAEPGSVYVDRETGEEMEPVAMVLPLAPSDSALPRTPDNLRACRRCDQLIGLDVSDCPYCGLRQTAL